MSFQSSPEHDSGKGHLWARVWKTAHFALIWETHSPSNRIKRSTILEHTRPWAPLWAPPAAITPRASLGTTPSYVYSRPRKRLICLRKHSFVYFEKITSRKVIQYFYFKSTKSISSFLKLCFEGLVSTHTSHLE